MNANFDLHGAVFKREFTKYHFSEQGLMLNESCLLVSESNKRVLSVSMTTGTLDVESVEKLKLISFNTSLTEDLRVSALEQVSIINHALIIFHVCSVIFHI